MVDFKFWKKKKDEFGELEESPLPEEKPQFGGIDEDMPRFSQPEEFRASAPPLGQQPAYPRQPEADMAAKNLEIISAKLDALRAQIENISQRLANIERIAMDEKKRTW